LPVSELLLSIAVSYIFCLQQNQQNRSFRC